MKSAKEIFEEFMVLSYSGSSKKAVREQLEDIKIGEYVLARKYEGNLTITYLTSGTSIQFPSELFLVLREFVINRGQEVVAINSVKKGDKVSKFLVLAVRLFYLLQNKSQIQPDDILQKLCETGSKSFVEWCNDRFGLQLTPIVYRSLSNNLELV